MPTFYSRFLPMGIQTRTHGLVQLRRLSVADAQFAITHQRFAPRVFAQIVIAHQLLSDAATMTPFAEWTDAELGHVSIMWLKQLGEPYWPPAVATSPLVMFQQRLCVGIGDAAATAQTIDDRALQPIMKVITAIMPAYTLAESVASLTRQFSLPSSGLNAITAGLAVLPATRVDAFLVRQWRDAFAMRPSISWQNGITGSAFSAWASSLVIPFQENSSNLAASFAVLQGQLREIVGGLSVIHAVGANLREIFQSLPPLDDVLKQLQQLDRRVSAGSNALDSNGFGFTVHLWSIYFIASLAAVDPRVRGAVITTRLAAYTRTPKFAAALQRLICSSPRIGRRWEAIQCVVQDHQQRDYVRSIRVGIPEIDGMLRDLQHVRGQACRIKGRWYVFKGGILVLDKNNKPLAINGLDMVLKHADFTNDTILIAVRHLLEEEFFIREKRNPISHGEPLPKDRAKTSAQILLLLYVFAQEIQKIEQSL